MKLGVAAEIWHVAEDLKSSARFYRALGMQVVEGSDSVSVACGSLHVRLVQNELPSPTLTYRTDTVKETAQHLEKLGARVEDAQYGSVVYGPEGERILLTPIEQDGLRNTADSIYSCLALPTPNVPRALVFWRMVGFLRIAGDPVRPNQWASIYDNRLPIILASPLSLAGPAIYLTGQLSETQHEALKAAGFEKNVRVASRAGATLYSPENQTLIYGRLA